MELLSVVIPVYNAEKHIEKTVDRLVKTLQGLGGNFEIVLVNDGSKDQTWKVLEKLTTEQKSLIVVDLMRNFGQDAAIMTGLHQCSGDYIVIMDDDLQHAPEEIPKLVSEIKQGFDIVYASFFRKKQSLIKNFGSWFNGQVAVIVIKKPRHIYLSPFKLFTKQVRDEIIKYDGPYPYVDGLIFRITNRIGQITVEHHSRIEGKGNYNLWRSVKVWSNLATNFSILPLRISMMMGFASATLAFLLTIYFLIEHFVGRPAPTGWASLIVTRLFFAGIELMFLGVLGEYVGRNFMHYAKTPQFVVRTRKGPSLAT